MIIRLPGGYNFSFMILFIYHLQSGLSRAILFLDNQTKCTLGLWGGLGWKCLCNKEEHRLDPHTAGRAACLQSQAQIAEAGSPWSKLASDTHTGKWVSGFDWETTPQRIKWMSEGSDGGGLPRWAASLQHRGRCTHVYTRACVHTHIHTNEKRGGSHPESTGAPNHTDRLLRHSCEKWEHRGM